MAKTLGIIVGIVFVLAAILGFVGTGIIGPEGTFVTNTAHDLVHLVTGLLFLVVAFTAADSLGKVFKIFGVVYLLVAVLGFFSGDSILGILTNNQADNWLHVVFGIVLLALGAATKKKDGMPMTPQMPQM